MTTVAAIPVRKILPCPFCGSAGQLLPSIIEGRQKILCSNVYCYVRPGITAVTEEKAIRRWNMRSGR
jgi:hypothetical protein